MRANIVMQAWYVLDPHSKFVILFQLGIDLVSRLTDYYCLKGKPGKGLW